ncbi:hypothetical protein GYH30_037600 [Glycine max]|nr:hypothetical protein GYH30_037600 [Glycine max]
MSFAPDSRSACATPFFSNNVTRRRLGPATTAPPSHHHCTSICVRESIFEASCARATSPLRGGVVAHRSVGVSVAWIAR